MRVLKFGGSSVADAERIRRAMDIVIRRRQAFGLVVLVLSAMKGVTDALLEASFAAAKGDQRYQERFYEILKKTEMVREQLAPGDKEVVEETDPFLEELSDLL